MRLRTGLIIALLAPAFAFAQGTSSDDAAAKALKELQSQLDAARKERLALEARLEKEMANDIASRAKGLSMGNEMQSLQRLEGLLDSAQSRLLLQRDRLRQLNDETVTTDRAVLVILVRADALPAGEIRATLSLDGAQAKSGAYTKDQVTAITAGAADELYRGDIAPSAHAVSVQLTGKGLAVNGTFSVTPAAKHVTYVEFALKGGKLVTTTWSN